MSKPKHVGVIGAGIAGLYIALLLSREGHRVTIFEAGNRVGGRIFTHRFTSSDKDEDAYFEAGAMRIPRSSLHRNVYQLIRYLNTHVSLKDKIELIPYVLEHPNNATFIQGKKLDFEDPNIGSFFNLPPEFKNKSARQILREVVIPWLKRLRNDFDAGFAQVMEYDEISFRTYLRFVAGWPNEVVDFVEMMASQTNQYDLSFTEIIMQNLDFDTEEWSTVQGGMSRLTQAAANLVGMENIYLNSTVVSVVECPDGRITLQTSGPTSRSATFDQVVLAIPPAAVYNIRERPLWDPLKEQSLRSAHYEPLYKMGLHFRTRFWERSSRPSFGGQSVTDLRFRWIVYPSNDLGSDRSGVLLLYCWMNDASRWQSLTQEQRISLALHDLQCFFGDENIDVSQQFIEAFDVIWSCEYATGDAMFLPGQFTRHYHIAKKPEGNIYFAGEHLSRHHTWIAGAIESAMETTKDILGLKNLSGLGDESLPAEVQIQKKEEKSKPNMSYLSHALASKMMLFE